MRNPLYAVIAIVTTLVLSQSVRAEEEHPHLDIAPYFISGQLLTGGMAHDGDAYSPPIRVFGYEFGEEPLDPFNITDPGVNQSAGAGNLPSGGVLRYNILGGLLYWDGEGDIAFGAPPTDTFLRLTMRGVTRSITAAGGVQTGSLIETIPANGSVHRHFFSELLANGTSTNIPGEAGFLAPADGFYAFPMELTLDYNSTLHTSPSLWIVYNNGLSESLHEQAMDYIYETYVPEPTAALSLAALALMALGTRRRSAR